MIAEFMLAYAEHCESYGEGPPGLFQKAKDFREVFGTAAGQRVLMELMHTAKLMRPSVEGDDGTVQLVEGRRSIVYEILREVTADFDASTQTVNYRI